MSKCKAEKILSSFPKWKRNLIKLSLKSTASKSRLKYKKPC